MKGTSIILVVVSILQSTFSIDPPQLQPFEFPNDLEMGSKVVAVCILREGDPPVTIVWKKDGQQLSHGGRLTIEQVNIDISNLKISIISPEDVGNYTCTATNSAGSDSFTAALVVRGPPFWLHEPINSQAVLGASQTTIHCSAGGYPRPKLLWFKKGPSGSLTPISRSYKMKVLDNGTLLINDVKETDSGTYLCQVENGVGESLEKAVRLSVHAPPLIQRERETLTFKRGETGLLSCATKGELPLIVKWLKNHGNLEPWSNSHETYTEDTFEGIKSILVLRNIQPHDSALYACKVRNNFGTDELSFNVIINEPPESPYQVALSDIRGRTARVTWQISTTLTAITQFIVRFWPTTGKKTTRRLQEETLSFDKRTLLLRDLHPGTEYTVEIQSENSIGFSEPSDPVRFTTMEEEPSSAPVDIKVAAVDSQTLMVSWKSPPREHWNGVLKGYYVSYKVKDSSNRFSYETVTTDDVIDNEIAIQGLNFGTEYVVTVKAFNSAGTGPSSEEVMCATLRGDPPSAPDLRLVSVNFDALKLDWRTPQINLPVLRESSDENSNTEPFYLRLYFIIPVATSVTVIICAVVVAWACLKKEHIVEKNQPIYVAYGTRSAYGPPPILDSCNSRILENGYDIPWDTPGYRISGSNDGNYTKLKPGNLQT
ncbi:cell adhesion molecule Dscam1-like isoform X2 [Tachypleus tridentatus]|uniref:cell adhesion molecule Dscam1-like isoform X2 n=1 Tax=Tachypleus tridentatus TaxID=6853 RepID=UPI003FD675F9